MRARQANPSNSFPVLPAPATGEGPRSRTVPPPRGELIRSQISSGHESPSARDNWHVVGGMARAGGREKEREREVFKDVHSSRWRRPQRRSGTPHKSDADRTFRIRFTEFHRNHCALFRSGDKFTLLPVDHSSRPPLASVPLFAVEFLAKWRFYNLSSRLYRSCFKYLHSHLYMFWEDNFLEIDSFYVLL